MSRAGETLVTTGNDEWYTPPDIIERARRVLGEINLDPASNAEANEWIKAGTYYTQEDDGLSLPWFGNVWLNPPYGRLASVFTKRLLDDYQAGHVASGIALINSNALGAKWGQLIWQYSAVCSPAKRIHFLKPGGGATSSTHGSLIAYTGPDLALFTEHFNDLGTIIQPRNTEP